MRSKAELNAISKYYRDKKHLEMLKLLNECKNKGLNIIESYYDEVTIKRCKKALNGGKF